MIKVILDTNFIIYCTENKLDYAAEIDKMMSEEVGPCIRAEGNPNNVVTMVQPHIPPDLTQWVELIRQDVRETMGFGRQQMGEAPTGRRTATEMDIVQMAKELRMDERRDMVADSLTDIVRKVNQVIFSNWDMGRVVQVVGVDAARYWVQFTKDAIVGEYNTKVDVESMTPVTKQIKKKEIIELVGVLSRVPNANIDYLLKLLLQQFDWMDAMQVFPPAPEMAGGQPMGSQQFIDQQQGLRANPATLQARVRANQPAIMGAVGQ